MSGNPAGRPTAGASIREWINWLAERDFTEPQLRQVARDRSVVWTKRAAAERILRTLEAGDLADFAGLLRGENNIEDLRAMGINTEVVKKIKQKTRRIPGTCEEVIEREIELHDRAGNDFDRVVDQTAGKPQQAIDHTSGGKPIGGDVVETVKRVIQDREALELANSLGRRMARHPGGDGEPAN